jgi:Leucine-rich repeat (LRR) protein
MERLIRHLESLRDSSFKVTRLDLRGWNLTEIPWIPARCIRVNLSGNRLTSLPELPDIIEILDIGDNMITDVVKWPKNLKWLRISGNPIRQIPPLPEGLEVFWAEGCVLDEFIRPASLLYLYVARSKTFL